MDEGFSEIKTDAGTQHVPASSLRVPQATGSSDYTAMAEKTAPLYPLQPPPHGGKAFILLGRIWILLPAFWNIRRLSSRALICLRLLEPERGLQGVECNTRDGGDVPSLGSLGPRILRTSPEVTVWILTT